jgi:iron-sulfur cluster repair di-iron protein
MPTLNSRTTVAELLDGPPALIGVLRSTGLYRDGDDPRVMLGQLCWTHGFSPAILVMMLQSATDAAEPAPVDMSPFQDMPIVDLVTHIEDVHHSFLRGAMPRLTGLAAAAAAAAPDDDQLRELNDLLRQLATELDSHLAHEEEALFPMIRSLVASNMPAETRCGSSVGGPIACMENEHDSTSRSLQRMRELTDDYTTPVSASEMLDGLRDLDRDLREHMCKENKVLFPRALVVQKEAGRSNLRESQPSPQAS